MRKLLLGLVSVALVLPSIAVAAAITADVRDVLLVFKIYPARQYVLTKGDAARLSLAASSLTKEERQIAFRELIKGPDFGGRYRLIALPDDSGEKVKVYVFDLAQNRGRWSNQIGAKIGSNFLYYRNSHGLVEGYLDYPSADCKVIAWKFDESSGEFEQLGVRDWPDGGGPCDVQKLRAR